MWCKTHWRSALEGRLPNPRFLILAFVVSFLLWGCKTTGTTPDSAEYNLFFSPASHVESLVEENKLADASEVYENQSDYFAEDSESAREAAELLASKLSEQLDPKALAAKQRLSDIVWPAERDRWPSIKQALLDAKAIQDEADQHAVLKRPKFRSAPLTELDGAISDLQDKLRASADAMFASYPLASEMSFFDAYPLSLEAETFLAGKSWTPALRDLSLQDIMKVSATYGDALPEPLAGELADAFFAASLRAQAGAGRPTLQNVIRALQATRSQGLTVTMIRSPQIVVAKVASPPAGSEFQATIADERPFQLVRGTVDTILREPSVASADIVLMLDVASASSVQDVVSYETVQSEYQSGTLSLPNPAFAAAKVAVAQAAADYQDVSLRSALQTGQYCYGWGCLAKAIGGIALAAEKSNAEEALQQATQSLANTPSTIEKPVYSPYTFTKAKVQVSKVAAVNYYLLEKGTGSYRSGTYQAHDTKQFVVADGVEPNERNRSTLLSDTSTNDDVKAFETSALEIDMSKLLRTVSSGGASKKALPALAQIRSDLLSKRRQVAAKPSQKTYEAKPDKDDERFRSTVFIATQAASGSGFFVTPDTVITNQHVVEGFEFVEMTMFGGEKTFGRVVATDPRLDLALVKVQARGHPVKIFSGDHVPLGARVEAIGNPGVGGLKLDFSITEGVISGIREIASVRVSVGKPVLYIQTDTPINPGNSGGPLFFGNYVVGVNTMGATKSKYEGLNFAVHYSEVLGFLTKNGLAGQGGS